jgi:3-hydroxyacyl-CoA dehydrogenase
MARVNPVLVVGDDGYAGALAGLVASGTHSAPGLVSPDAPDLQDRLAAAGWIIEAAGQDPERKRAVLARCAETGCPIVTSDSSVITRAELIGGLPADFQRRHAVAHFFFPLKHCPLVELVTGSEGTAQLDDEAAAALTVRLSEELGRAVVRLPDSAGFCANRVGLFVLAAAFSRARSSGADRAVIDRLAIPALGLPRSGLFGTADLIGLPTLTALLSSTVQRLPADDPMHGHAPSALAALAQPAAVGPDHGAEVVVAALAHDRDRYMELVAAQNGIGMATLWQVMNKSYGWSR